MEECRPVYRHQSPAPGLHPSLLPGPTEQPSKGNHVDACENIPCIPYIHGYKNSRCSRQLHFRPEDD